MVLLNFCAPALLFVSADRSECVHNRGGRLDWVCKPMVGLSLWSVYMGEGQVFHFGVGGRKCFPFHAAVELAIVSAQNAVRLFKLLFFFSSPSRWKCDTESMLQLPPDDDSKVEQRQNCEEDQKSHAAHYRDQSASRNPNQGRQQQQAPRQ